MIENQLSKSFENCKFHGVNLIFNSSFLIIPENKPLTWRKASLVSCIYLSLILLILFVLRRRVTLLMRVQNYLGSERNTWLPSYEMIYTSVETAWQFVRAVLDLLSSNFLLRTSRIEKEQYFMRVRFQENGCREYVSSSSDDRIMILSSRIFFAIFYLRKKLIFRVLLLVQRNFASGFVSKKEEKRKRKKKYLIE